MTTDTLNARPSSLVFSFGDPEPILNNSYLDYLGVYLDLFGDYYRPPMDWAGIAKLEGANAYHGAILRFKLNMICKWFIPNRVLSLTEFELLALNFLITGNGYLQQLTNGFGRLAQLKSRPALALRRKKQADQYLHLKDDGGWQDYAVGEIVHVKEPDIKQDIYGIPPYYGGIQSVLLGEDATLFKRKYYINGSHMGYILVTQDADIDDETAQLIEKKVKESKGPGNFRSMYLNIGKTNAREPVKIIPVGNFATTDEYQAVKGITKDEMLSMHRMQPGLSGIIPEKMTGFGDMQKLLEVYHEAEVTALQQSFLKINEVLGARVVQFREPRWVQAV